MTNCTQINQFLDEGNAKEVEHLVREALDEAGAKIDGKVSVAGGKLWLKH
jgi:phage terminase large subunit